MKKPPKKQLSTIHKIELFKKFVDLEYYDGLTTLLKEPFKINKVELEDIEKHTQKTKNNLLQSFVDKRLLKTRNYVLKNVGNNTQDLKDYVDVVSDGVLEKSLIKAFKNKNFELLYEIAKKKPEILLNYPSAKVSQINPLHLVCTFGTKKQVQDIIDLGIDIQAYTNKKTNAAHFAISFFNVEALEVLKSNGFNFKKLTPPASIQNQTEMYYTFKKSLHHQEIPYNTAKVKYLDGNERINNYTAWAAVCVDMETDYKAFSKKDFEDLACITKFLKEIEPKQLLDDNKNILHYFFEHATYGDYTSSISKDHNATLALIVKLGELGVADLLRQSDAQGKIPLDYINHKKLKAVLKTKSEEIELKTLPSNSNLVSKKAKLL